MRTILYLFIAILFSANAFGQSPNRMSYQAVIRNGGGALVANSPVGMRIQILQGSQFGAASYVETHTLTTNTNGLATLEIGGGTVVAGFFANVNWANGPYFLKTETDPAGGANYSITGISQLLSVPYALYAAQSGSSFTAGPGIGIVGNTISNTAPDQPITLTGSGATSVSGAYPNFTISSSGTATPYTAGAGIDINGNIISNTGDLSNTNEIQSLALNGANLSLSNGGGSVTLPTGTTYAAGTGIAIVGNTILNTAPNQPLTLTGSGATSVSGAYPNFTVNSTDNNTVYNAGTGIGIVGNTINNTGDGDSNPTNELQSISLNGANLSLSNGGGSVTLPTGTTYTAGAGIGIVGNAISNTAPNQPISLSGGGATTVSGAYPNFVVTSTDNSASYTAGNGIGINGTTITNTGDLSNTNEIQTLSLAGAVLSLSNGGGNVGLPAGWSLNGNTGTTPTDFIGTTDGKPLSFRVNNQPAGFIDPSIDDNTAFGKGAMQSLTNGFENTAFGKNALMSTTTGSKNTATGRNALNNNTIGGSNTATGHQALFANTSGIANTATGEGALYANTTGIRNTAGGTDALTTNTTGSYNTANGRNSLTLNTTGSNNTATGADALYSNQANNRSTAIGVEAMYYADNRIVGRETYNTALGYQALYGGIAAALNSGQFNTALGDQALFSNTNGSSNTAGGVKALYLNTTGGANTAFGRSALENNTTGSNNTAYGRGALLANVAGSNNTAVGITALSTITGSNNTALGHNANPLIDGVTNYTGIGYNAGTMASTNNRMEIGNSSVTWIGGQVGWTTFSDERIKENIQANVPGIAFINKLRPVTYRYNIHKENELLYAGKKDDPDWDGKYDIEKMTFTGFLAQEVEQAAKATNFDFSGVTKPQHENDLYSVRYAEFVVPLVKAVQEQQAQIEQLKAENQQMKAELQIIKEKLGLK